MPQFAIAENPVPYTMALEHMNATVDCIIKGESESVFWFLEHPHIYTKGSSGDDSQLINCKNIPIFDCDRGGKYTYHGPGQRIVYCMVDLERFFNKDLGAYVKAIEKILVEVLALFGIKSISRYCGNVGVWASTQDGCGWAKIASIGIKVRRWVSWHGFAINVMPDLSYYKGIVPCGIKGVQMTSMHALGFKGGYEEVDVAILECLQKVLGMKLHKAKALSYL